MERGAQASDRDATDIGAVPRRPRSDLPVALPLPTATTAASIISMYLYSSSSRRIMSSMLLRALFTRQPLERNRGPKDIVSTKREGMRSR